MSKVGELRQLNGDFLSLIQSIENLQSIQGKQEEISQWGPGQSVEGFKFVQTASLRLYEALSNVWSCSVHEGHSADICLEHWNKDALNNTTDLRSGPREIFEIAFDVISSSTACSNSPVWLEIETCTGSHNESDPPAEHHPSTDKGSTASPVPVPKSLTNNALRNVSVDLSTTRRKGTELSLVLFPNNPRERGKSIKRDDVTISEQLLSREIDGQPDLCSRQDLCPHLHRIYGQCADAASSNTSVCVGILQKTKTFKHVMYHQPAKQHLNRSVSLEEVISCISAAKPLGGLTGLERVRLALSLARAVLRFHASPWIPENWRSENIRFYGVDSSNVQRPDSLKAPFLNLKISGPYGPAQTNPSNDPLSPIRNNILFGLGIMLLELGFESPLKGLHNAQDKERGAENADYLAARRLKSTIGTPLGSRYGRIAKKCLDCEFNVAGHDLRDSTLQAAFFKDVVLELQALERKFGELNMDC